MAAAIYSSPLRQRPVEHIQGGDQIRLFIDLFARAFFMSLTANYYLHKYDFIDYFYGCTTDCSGYKLDLAISNLFIKVFIGTCLIGVGLIALRKFRQNPLN